VVGSIVGERLLDVAALSAMLAVLTWTGLGGATEGRMPAAVGVLLIVAGAVTVSAYLRLRDRRRMQRFAEFMRPFARASRRMLDRGGLGLVVLSIGIWTIEGVIFYLVGRAIGAGLSVPGGIFIVVLASFFALIPAAPGYVGTFDAAVLFGLSALSIKGGVAVSFAVLVRFILFVPITVTGFALMMTRYGGLALLRRRRLARGALVQEPVGLALAEPERAYGTRASGR
jgi:uncharacterized membrane protein YbhN (UPF0104 family)